MSWYSTRLKKKEREGGNTHKQKGQRKQKSLTKRRGSYMATSDVGSGKGPEPGDVAQSRSGLFITTMARD